MEMLIILLISILGLISLLKTFITFLNWIWIMFLRPPKDLTKYGSWAVITGPTDGIGKALAFELASKGLNLLLVGRSPSKLQSISNEIRGIYRSEIEIKTVTLDFAKSTGGNVAKRIGDAIEGLDVGILINNAGVGLPYPILFDEIDSELTESLVKVNVEAPIWVTRAVLPVMLKKRKGAIVNIGSGSADDVISYPFHNIYAPTKSYLSMFSKSLYLEYKKNGIDIQCQVPLYVATKMSNRKSQPFFVASPGIYSKASVRQIGYEPWCVPCWSHCVQIFVLRALSSKLFDRLLFTYFEDIRRIKLVNLSMKKEGRP